MGIDKNKQLVPELLNTFLKGMDTDTADGIMSDSSYRHSENMRLVTDSASLTGKLSLILGITNRTIKLEVPYSDVSPATELKYKDGDWSNYTILGSISNRNVGIVIYYDDNGWYVGRFNNDIDNELENLTITQIFGPDSTPIGNVNGDTKPSLDIRFEDLDNIKIYIADGVHYIRSLHVSDDTTRLLYNFTLQGNDDKITIYPKITLDLMQFLGLTSGNLNSMEVQYTYRLVNPLGNATNIAPLTGIILVTKNYSGILDVKGWYKDKSTGSGVILKLTNLDYEDFKHIYVYRISYIEQGQDPTVELISDAILTSSTFTITDIGQKAQSTLTIDEFNDISGTLIIPRYIEDKNDYLFASNIKLKESDQWTNLKDYDARAFAYNINGETYHTSDDVDVNPYVSLICKTTDILSSTDATKYTYCSDHNFYGATGNNISYKFTYTDFPIDKTVYDDYINITKDEIKINQLIENYNILINPTLEKTYSVKYGYITKDGKYYLNQTISYDNQIITSYTDALFTYNFKSLRRDEVYRYAVVFYNQYGQRSPALWIADIRIPSIDSKGFEYFYMNGYTDCYARQIGLEFTINNFPKDVIGYEIVRAKRTDSDRSILTQCVISRNVVPCGTALTTDKNKFPLEPSDLICVNPIRYSTYKDNTSDYYHTFPSISRLNVYDSKVDKSSRNDLHGYNCSYSSGNYSFACECISPEISFNYDLLKLRLKNKQLYLDVLQYIYDCGITDSFGDGTEVFTNDLYHKQIYSKSTSTNQNLFFPISKDNEIYFTNIQEQYRNTYSILKIKLGSVTNIKTLLYNTTESPYYYCMFLNVLISGRMEIGQWDTPDEIRYVNQRPSSIQNSFLSGCSLDEEKKYQDTVSNFSKLYRSTEYIIKSYPFLLLSQYGTKESTTLKVYTQEEINLDPSLSVNSVGYVKKLSTFSDIVGVLKDSQAYYIEGFGTGMWWSLQDPTLLLDDNLYRQMSFLLKDGDSPVSCRKILNVTDFDSVSEGSWNSYEKRKDLVSTIGGKLYCNWFSGGYYWQTDNSAMCGGGCGPNGRCMEMMVLDTNDSQLLLTFGDGKYLMSYGTGKLDQSVPGYLIPPASLCGTYLCNVRHDIIPYGGLDKEQRQYTNYYSFGDYKKATDENKSILVKSGDTYIGIYEHIKIHKYYDKNAIRSDDFMYCNNLCNVYQIPMESDVNLAIVQGVLFWRNETDSNQLIEASDVYGMYSQDIPKYEYNTIYSITPTANIDTAITDTWFDTGYQLNNEDYRCYYSNLKTNNETIDSWSTFMTNHFLDADSGYGPITNLRRFNNKLIFWQPNAVGIYAVNDRSMITDNTNLPLTLGTGGVLDRYDYLPTSNGMAENLMCDAQSDFTLYWYDSNKNELLGLGANGEVLILSKIKSCLSTLNKQKDNKLLLHQLSSNTAIMTIPELTFDKHYNELLASISYKYGSMIYNENIQAFTGWYNIIFRGKLPFANGQYLITGINNIEQYNKNNSDIPKGYMNGEISINPKLLYIVNDIFYTTKVFDNQEVDGVLHNHPVKDNTEAKDTELYKLLFEYSTPNNQTASCTGEQVTLREKNYRLAIPRDGNADYGNRMRGKTLDCTISTTKPTSLPFDILYILTKYRKSW